MKSKVPNSVELIDNHLDLFFDEDVDIIVFDEIESEIIHRDIFVIKPTDNMPFNILLSCGMSALPMQIPKNINTSEFIEIIMLLPKEWNLNHASFEDERNYWPIRLMKEIMMLPHANKTWMDYGHSYGHTEGVEFAEGVGFNSVLLAHSMEMSSDFMQIKLDNNKVVDIYTLIPLYKEELEFKKKNGADKLLEKLDEFKISEVVKVGRKNVCE